MNVLTMSGMLVDLLVWLYGYLYVWFRIPGGIKKGFTRWPDAGTFGKQNKVCNTQRKNSKRGEIYLMFFFGSLHFFGQMLEAQAKVQKITIFLSSPERDHADLGFHVCLYNEKMVDLIYSRAKKLLYLFNLVKLELLYQK